MFEPNVIIRTLTHYSRVWQLRLGRLKFTMWLIIAVSDIPPPPTDCGDTVDVKNFWEDLENNIFNGAITKGKYTLQFTIPTKSIPLK